jgi:cobalt/nickel transport system permease protein
MSHIHIPDGVLPWWLIGLGWLLAAAGVAFAARQIRRQQLQRRVPLVGAVAALMLVGMSSEILPIAYHVNLTVVAGILLGPWLSIVTALVVNVFLGFVGHGGVTVIGLNTVVIAVEMVLGWMLFGLLRRLLGRERAPWAAGLATIGSLALSASLLVGIVAVGGPAAATRESGALDPQALRFDNPWSHGVVTNVLVAPEKAQPAPRLSLTRFAAMVGLLGSLGWMIEALLTAAIIRFAARVRPSLIFEGGAVDLSMARDVGHRSHH